MDLFITRRGGEAYKLPILDANYPQDATVLASKDGSALFSVAISEAGKPEKYSYQWYVDGEAIDGAINPVYTHTGLTSVGSRAVYCVVTNKAGSVTSRIAVLNVESPAPSFTYTGDYSIEGEGIDWKIKFLTSGDLTLTKLNSPIDVFIVGGGGGAAYCLGGYMCWSAGAGGGGYTATYTNLIPELNTPYTIIIGGGGSAGYASNSSGGGDGGKSSAFGYSADGGKGGGYKTGGNGGSGGGAFSGQGGSDGEDGHSDSQPITAHGVGQHTTTREFGETTGDLYSTGGSTTFDKAGAANTGDGGSAYGNYGGSAEDGLPGGSGIVIIRGSR